MSAILTLAEVSAILTGAEVSMILNRAELSAILVSSLGTYFNFVLWKGALRTAPGERICRLIPKLGY